MAQAKDCSRPTLPAAPGEGLKGPCFARQSGSVGQWPSALRAYGPPGLLAAHEVSHKGRVKTRFLTRGSLDRFAFSP